MARRAKHAIKLVVIATVALPVGGLVLHRCYRRFVSIEVCLHNVDNQPLRSGEVAVRSSVSTWTSAVGDLAPNAETCVLIKPENVASVDVTFTMPNGAPRVIPLAGYIESDNNGWISADVTREGARSIDDKIGFY